jgi:hypothetical protein
MLDLSRARKLASLTTAIAAIAGGCAGGSSKRATGYGDSPSSTAMYPGRPVGGADMAGSPGSSHGSIAVPVPAPDPTERPGLGTSWGEQVWSPTTTQPFVRSSPSAWATVALHYNDRDGVMAHAAYLGATPSPLEVYAGDGSIGISLVDEHGSLMPGIHAGGRALVAGDDGARYKIVVRNGTSARFEVVASVDGNDVIDGRPADPARRGYLVDPHGVLVIDGFRTSDDQVAAFRFGRVADSYAAKTTGDRNVGVIGFAIFAERGAVWTPAELHRRDTADPFPASRSYATPP